MIGNKMVVRTELIKVHKNINAEDILWRRHITVKINYKYTIQLVKINGIENVEM